MAKKEKGNAFVKMLLDGLKNLKDYLLKPLDSIKEKSTEDLKQVGITGGILVVLMMLVNLIMTMIGSLKSTSFDIFTGKTTTTIDFGNLGELNYLSLIFKNLFIYALVILAIAGIFYLGSLIIKKEIKFTKLLSITYIATIPFFIGTTVLATILGFIFNSLAVIVSIITSIYAICVFAYLVNDEIKLNGITRVYYNAACFSIIIITVYFVIIKIIESALSIGNLFNF